MSILNTAFEKLFPTESISILIQDAFDRGFIKMLLSREEIFKAHPQKQFFALFDFDDAYEDWRSMRGETVVEEISKGLCKKLVDKNAHVFLLPIPDNQLKSQVWNEDNSLEKIKQKPHFCIEHIFWGQPGFENYYEEQEHHGCKEIRFKVKKNNKVNFAKTVIPNVNADCFEVFRPMFEFIRSKCPS